MIGAYLCEFTQRMYLTCIYVLVNFIFHILYSGILGRIFLLQIICQKCLMKDWYSYIWNRKEKVIVFWEGHCSELYEHRGTLTLPFPLYDSHHLNFSESLSSFATSILACPMGHVETQFIKHLHRFNALPHES